MEAWRTWSRERLEREYSPSSRVESIEPFVRAYAERSRAVLRTLPVRRDIHYGPGPDEILDLVPAAPGAPLVVFLHGGYWQELGKVDSLFPAPALAEAGIAYAAGEHTLAPRGSLGGIVGQVRRVILLKEGNILGMGSPDEVLTEAKLKEAFDIDISVRRDAAGKASIGYEPHFFQETDI